MEMKHEPVVLILSRQALPILDRSSSLQPQGFDVVRMCFQMQLTGNQRYC